MAKLTKVTQLTIREEIFWEPDYDWLPEEAWVVVANWLWLVEHRDAKLDMKTSTVFVRDGGYDISCLFRRGFTPATRDFDYYFGERNDARADSTHRSVGAQDRGAGPSRRVA